MRSRATISHVSAKTALMGGGAGAGKGKADGAEGQVEKDLRSHQQEQTQQRVGARAAAGEDRHGRKKVVDHRALVVPNVAVHHLAVNKGPRGGAVVGLVRAAERCIGREGDHSDEKAKGWHRNTKRTRGHMACMGKLSLD